MFLALFSRLYGNPTPAFPLFHEDGIPWFLYALAAYTALAWLLRKQNIRFLLPAAVALGCFIGYDASIGDTLCLSRIIVFAPFFFAGVWADPQTLLRWKQKYRWLVFPAALALLGWAAVCFLKPDALYGLRHLFTGRHPFSEAAAPYGPLLRLGCYLLAALLGGSLIVLTPSRRFAGVTALGANSLNVYFWHWIVYMTLEHFFRFKNLFSMGVWGKAAFLLLAVPVTVLLAAVPVFRFPLEQVRKAIFRKPAAPPEKPVKSE